MSITKEVIRAQTKIINDLARCEEALSTLYATYSKCIPDQEEFWKELSRNEKVHADVLGTMHKQLASGHIFYNIGRFNLASIETFLNRVNDAIAHAKDNPISPLQGITMALSVESSLLDAHFYDIVKSDAPEYRYIADRLSTDTHEHVKVVQNKLLEIQSNNSMLGDA